MKHADNIREPRPLQATGMVPDQLDEIRKRLDKLEASAIVDTLVLADVVRILADIETGDKT